MRGAKICVIDTRLSATPRRWPTTGCRRGRAPRPRCSSPWPTCSSRERPLRPRVRPPLGQLGGVPARGAARPAGRPSRPSSARSTSSTRRTRRSSPSAESGVPAATIVEVARRDRRAPARRSPPTSGATPRRATSAAGRWRARSSCSSCSMGAVGTPGGTAPSAWNKAVPAPPMMPPPGKVWSELLMPREYPLAFFEMSFLLPHFLQGGARQARHVLHARLQPGVDQPRRHVVDRDADGRGEGRAPRLPHADLERDGVVRRLRAADGARLRAPRPHEPGDARRALDRLPPARAAGGARAPGQELRLDLAGPRGGRARAGVGGGRVLDRAVVADRSRRRARHPQVLRVAVPARREARASRSTTAGSSRTPCPGCPRPRRRRG